MYYQKLADFDSLEVSLLCSQYVQGLGHPGDAERIGHLQGSCSSRADALKVQHEYAALEST
jgi:hypothetical protein